MKTKSTLVFILTMFISLSLIAQVQKIVPDDLGDDDNFGFVIASNGAELLIGASRADDFANGGGAAYTFIFDNGEWVQSGKIVPESLEGDEFGSWVSLSDDYAILSSIQNDELATNAGAIEIYRRDGSSWVRDRRILSPDLVEGSFFGWQTAVDGNLAVASAITSNNSEGVSTGKIFVFQRDAAEGWSQIADLAPSDGNTGDIFGGSVFLRGDLVLVGSRRNDEFSEDGGAIYIYEKLPGEWKETKLAISDVGPEALLGYRVHTDGEKIMLSGYGENELTGSVYIFSKINDEWTEEVKLVPVDASAGDWFGSSISIVGDRAFVGARSHQGNGALYIYDFDGTIWTEYVKLQASDGEENDLFGAGHVVTDNNQLIVGANNSNGGSGAIYAFDLNLVSDINELITSEVSIFPNPVTDQINIASDVEAQSILIHNLQGQLIAKYSKGITSINVMHLAPGNYVLSISNAKGETVHSKFIKL